MAVTQRDFEAIAKAIRDQREVAYACNDHIAANYLRQLALSLAGYLGEQNPRFDKVRFIDATAPRPEIVEVADKARAR